MGIPIEAVYFLLRIDVLGLTGLMVGVVAWYREHRNPNRKMTLHGFFSAYLSGTLFPVGLAFILLLLVDASTTVPEALERIKLYLPIAGICLIWVALKTIADSTAPRSTDSPTPSSDELDTGQGRRR